MYRLETMEGKRLAEKINTVPDASSPNGEYLALIRLAACVFVSDFYIERRKGSMLRET